MAKQNDTNLEVIGTVLYTDSEPSKQPKGTHRYALNAISETAEGGKVSLTNEPSFSESAALPSGFTPIGQTYLGDDLSFLILKNELTGYEDLGLLDKNDTYTSLVNTNTLSLSIRYQCQVIFRLRRGSERVVYWVDGKNKARTFNIDRPHNFYTLAYQQYLKTGGNPSTYTGEKWDASSFDLIKSYKSIPFFSDTKIIETGNILPGSYNFAIQYVDEDLNPTEWITTSNTIRIYNDTVTNPYERIRGSKNVNTLEQQFDRANKSIKLTITNLDTNFPYYRVAIIKASNTNGEPDNKVLASPVQSTSDSSFTYTGNDSQLTEVNLGDILIEKEVIYAPRHIGQDENKLILAHTQGKGINWCEFQKYASKISSDLVTKEVLLNSILSEGNPKNAKSTFTFRGNMPGEVYSYGIVYIFPDNYLSPSFHIPGIGPNNTTSKLKFYEGETRYLDIHNCSTDNYWGKDADGDSLVGQRVRFHRFPFRKDVNKPLVTRTTTTNNINRYRLRVNITLASGKTYPLDTSSNAIPIDYTFNFHINSTPSTTGISGILTQGDLGRDIYLYDDITELQDITTGVKGQLEPTCQLATSYMVSGNETFVITFTYDSVVASTSVNDDRSELFGIEFSNIEKPHPDVIGFYIVRNERTDDDKLIVDNAVLGTMTEFNQYKSFGLLTPKQYYTANNCGRVGNSGKTLNFFDKGAWFFNPEFQFFNKKTDFDKLEVEGVYSQASVNMPTISLTEGSPCHGGTGTSNRFGSKGLYINDVQAGTSYNPDVNKAKNKDDDGFDLIVGYKNTNFTYAPNTTLVFPQKKTVYYLNAASYQNADGNTYYNVSTDNKIGQYITNDAFSTALKDTLHNAGTNANNLVYACMVKNNTSAYSNFINRPYYKEHNNPIYFGSNNRIDGVKIFNGDAEISALHIVSSVYYDMVVADRPKKSGVWKIIVGAILTIAAIAATIVTGGAASPLIALAISYGVSLVASGIKIEQFKAMLDIDYGKGLKETITDGALYECVRDTIGTADDSIRWFCDRVSNIYIETSVPMALRSGLTFGVSDFIDAPAPYNEEAFRSYITEKLTALDRDQGSGRLYRGFASAEFYDVNKDYLRFNKQKLFIHLPVEYDCCADKNEVYPMRYWASEQSFQEEKIDNYRVFLPNNYRDIEGEFGEITNIYKLGNNVFIETRNATWQIPQSQQERTTDEIVSFIGTGGIFAIPPRRVLDDNLGAGGTQHKWGTIKTKQGVISINESQHKIYLHADKFRDITEGNETWFNTNLRSFLSAQLFKRFNILYLHDNNPASPDGVGYHTTYDTKLNRVIITKKDYQVLQEKINGLIVVAKKPIQSGEQFAYCVEDGYFYLGTHKLSLSNSSFFEGKGWTISYSFRDKGFVSFHSYLPDFYIHRQDSLFAFRTEDGLNRLWKFHRKGHVQTFFGNYYPFIIEYVAQQDPLSERIIEDITIDTRARRWDATTNMYKDEELITFNKLTAFNTKHCTGETSVRAKELYTNNQDWLQEQVANLVGTILAERVNKKWNINDLRDYVVNYNVPFFSSSWADTKLLYPIDKVINPQAIDFNKPWQELQSLRDKYVIIRLKFDNFNDVSLTFNYSLDTEPPSE